MNPIALKIKDARVKANMSEKDLAKKCGVAPSYIIQIESGKKIINEVTAEKILAVFGQKVGFDFGDQAEEEKPVEKKPEKKKEIAPVYYDVEPNDQWAGALANIIKKYPIEEVTTKKVVGYKELPIIAKKVEGIPWEKLMFVQAMNDDLKAVRIRKGDTVMMSMVKEIQGKGVYLVEVDQKRQLKVVFNESANKLNVSNGNKELPGETMEVSKVKVLAKGIRVEFTLG